MQEARLEPIQQINPTVYEPPELVANLKVGARVQYRISTECTCACPECGFLIHPEAWGNVGYGEIQEISNKPLHCTPSLGGCGAMVFTHMGHTYKVIVNPDGDMGFSGFWACAAELTPLEDDDGK